MSVVKLRVKRLSKSTPNVKTKTLKSASKRLKALKSGNIVRTKAGKKHNMSQKSSDQLFRQSGTTMIDSSFLKMARRALVVGLGKKFKKQKYDNYCGKINKFGNIAKCFSKLTKSDS